MELTWSCRHPGSTFTAVGKPLEDMYILSDVVLADLVLVTDIPVQDLKKLLVFVLGEDCRVMILDDDPLVFRVDDPSMVPLYLLYL